MLPKKCVLNDRITLKLEKGQTRIYVNGKYFMHCLKLVLNIPRRDLKTLNELSSIDKFADAYQHRQFDGWLTSDGELIDDEEVDWDFISLEEEFTAHCSNLQAWIENDYDTRLLKADLAFPLLKKLADEGDERARIRLKEEILKRYESGYESVIEYLFIEGFFDYLTREELLQSILDDYNAMMIKQLEEEYKIYFQFVPDLYFFPKNYSMLSNHRRFSAKNKKIISMDLRYHQLLSNYPNFKIIPTKLVEIESLAILDLSGHDIDLNNDINKKRISQMKSLKIMVIDKKVISNTHQSNLEEYRRKNLTLAPRFMDVINLVKKISY